MKREAKGWTVASFAAVILSACAAGPGPTDQVISADSKPAAGLIRVIVYRPWAFPGSLFADDISVNGRIVCSISNDSAIAFDVPPGMASLSVSVMGVSGSGVGLYASEQETMNYVRLDIDRRHGPTLIRVDDSATSELKDFTIRLCK